MSLSNPIGGYFGLELSVKKSFLHNDATLLNSGRACFEYILSSNKVTKVYISKYTCDVMLEPLKKLDIPYSFYEINEKLEIAEDIKLAADEYIIYVNYFGLKDAYCSELTTKYGSNLVLDNSQALFADPAATGHTLYSPRKFFGLPDGGMLYTQTQLTTSLPKDQSFGRTSHLLKRIDAGAEYGYEDYKRNDGSLKDAPLKIMSELTRSLLSSIDFEGASKQRLTNFSVLHKDLTSSNKLVLSDTYAKAPMCYPYYTDQGDNLRKKLINKKVFVATYWPNVFEWCSPEDLEYMLAENIVPLPIDQRYDENDMRRILEVIHE